MLAASTSVVGFPESRDRPALFALGPEHLLAVNLVIGDCLLAFVRNEPVDELLAKRLLHMRMIGRVNKDDTVLVNSSLSPTTAMTRSALFLNESHVPRSDIT